MNDPTSWSGIDNSIGESVSGATPFVQGAANLVGTATSNIVQTQNQASTDSTSLVTLLKFEPTSFANFTFNANFDGTAYNVVINWNFYGQRYYVNIFSIQGTRILTIPLIASPDGYNISMTAGYFTTTLIYRASSGNIEISA